MDRREQHQRAKRERTALDQALQEQRPITYVDTDGCEVTVMPSGHIFYNVADWW